MTEPSGTSRLRFHPVPHNGEPVTSALLTTGAAGFRRAPTARDLTRGTPDRGAASVIVQEVLTDLEGIDRATITATAAWWSRPRPDRSYFRRTG